MSDRSDLERLIEQVFRGQRQQVEKANSVCKRLSKTVQNEEEKGQIFNFFKIILTSHGNSLSCHSAKKVIDKLDQANPEELLLEFRSRIQQYRQDSREAVGQGQAIVMEISKVSEEQVESELDQFGRPIQIPEGQAITLTAVGIGEISVAQLMGVQNQYRDLPSIQYNLRQTFDRGIARLEEKGEAEEIVIAGMDQNDNIQKTFQRGKQFNSDVLSFMKRILFINVHGPVRPYRYLNQLPVNNNIKYNIRILIRWVLQGPLQSKVRQCRYSFFADYLSRRMQFNEQQAQKFQKQTALDSSLKASISEVNKCRNNQDLLNLTWDIRQKIDSFLNKLIRHKRNRRALIEQSGFMDLSNLQHTADYYQHVGAKFMGLVQSDGVRKAIQEYWTRQEKNIKLQFLQYVLLTIKGVMNFFENKQEFMTFVKEFPLKFEQRMYLQQIDHTIIQALKIKEGHPNRHPNQNIAELVEQI